MKKRLASCAGAARAAAEPACRRPRAVRCLLASPSEAERGLDHAACTTQGGPFAACQTFLLRTGIQDALPACRPLSITTEVPDARNISTISMCARTHAVSMGVAPVWSTWLTSAPCSIRRRESATSPRSTALMSGPRPWQVQVTSVVARALRSSSERSKCLHSLFPFVTSQICRELATSKPAREKACQRVGGQRRTVLSAHTCVPGFICEVDVGTMLDQESHSFLTVG